jgi:hypothetical protein
MLGSNDFSVTGCADMTITLEGGDDFTAFMGTMSDLKSDGYTASYVFSPADYFVDTRTCWTLADDTYG